MVAGGRIKKDAQIDKADLIRIKIVLFVQLWHLRNGWHDAHKADLISLWSVGVWGVINLMEGYGNDNPGAKSQGIKQLMSGGGVILIGTQLIPLLSGLFG